MRVLLLEDDAMIGEGLSRTLAEEGMSVDWLHDGSEAEAALGDGGQPPLRLHVKLKALVVGDGTRADPTYRRLHALGLDRTDHIRWCQPKTRQPFHIEPDAHRIVHATEQLRRADTGGSGQLVQHVDRGVVRHEQCVVLLRRTIDGDELQNGRRLLLNREAERPDLGRKLGKGGLNPIIDIDCIDVGVRSEGEADG